MRALLIALVVLALVPAASGAKDPIVNVDVDPTLEVGEDCKTCVTAGLMVSQGYDNSCADCPGVWAGGEVSTDGRSTTASAEVCRGGFFTICLVDQEVTV